MLTVALVLVIGGGVWLAWRRRGSGELLKMPKAEAKPYLDRVGPHVDKVRRGWRGWLRLPGRKSGLAPQFRAWIAEVEARGLFPDARFVAWLEQRSDQELSAYAGQVAAFCRSSGFDLTWVLTAKEKSEPLWAMEKPVLTGGQAIWSAGDSQPFVPYLRWQQAPGEKSTSAFETLLYGKLMEAGLAATPADLLLAKEKERKRHVRQAIEKAAQDGEDFNAILRSIAEAPAPPEKVKEKASKRGAASKAAAAAAV